MNLTQQQIDVLSQNLRKKRLRIELLDSNMKTIESIEGRAINGSITANADNDIRRSGNIELVIEHPTNATIFLDSLISPLIDFNNEIWLDKYIKISVGIDDLLSQDQTIWYKMGVFLINKPVRSFSGGSDTISFECVDLMAKLTGLRNGQLTGPTTIIPKDGYANGVYTQTTLTEALITTIRDLGGFNKFMIYPIPDTYKYLPYDIKIGVGATVYDLLKQLMDIIPTWQMYFDLDGTFIVEPIPTGKNAIIYDIEKTQYITDTIEIDLGNVKNQVVVYGRLNTLTYYTENTTDAPNNVVYDSTNKEIRLTYAALNTDNFTIKGTTFGFKSLDQYNPTEFNTISIYNGNTLVVTKPLVKFENTTTSFGQTYATTQIEAYSIAPSEIYFVRIYDTTNSAVSDDGFVEDVSTITAFEFMGKQQVAYNLVNDNKESQFYINANLQVENYYAGLAKPTESLVYTAKVDPTATDINNFVIGLGYSAPFTDVSVIVGQTFHIWRYNTTTSQWQDDGLNTLGSNYLLELNNDVPITELSNSTVITFMADYINSAAPTVTIKLAGSTTNLLSNIPIVQNTWVSNTRPALQENKLYNDYTIWQLRYEKNNNWFVLEGRWSGAVSLILSAGEYDNIYADQLAYERCLYELFQRSNMNDSITLGVVPNYVIDVNCRIQSSPIYESDESVAYDYITKNITYPLGVDTTAQTITAIRIYDSGNLLGEN